MDKHEINNRKVTVLGAIASTTGITLYLQDGSELNLLPDSHRTHEIMEKIQGPLARRKPAVIDLGAYSAHKVVEQKSGGLIKFFRRKISEVGAVIGLGKSVPDSSSTPIGSFGLRKDETIVAVVDGKEIPGMENLENHIERAAYGEDFEGFSKFMSFLSEVVEDRGHSVQELLTFMQRCDMPIALDGSIVGFKTLNNSDVNDVYVDIHSGKVMQRVGSRVSMPHSKVDADRRTLCSTGLHIARRQYLRGYFGTVLMLVKIDPRDVIAVPKGEQSKMRCAAYHIVAQLPDEALKLVKRDKPITEDKPSARILADVIKGNHIAVTEEVEIYGAYGTDLKTKDTGASHKFLGGGQNGMAAAIDIDKKADKTTPIDVQKMNSEVEKIVEKEMAKKKHENKKAATPTDSEGPTPDMLKAFAMLKDGNSKAEVSRVFGVSARTVGRWIDKFPDGEAVKPTPPAVPKKVSKAKLPKSGQEDLKATAVAAVRNGMSMTEAQRQFGVSRKVIARIIKNSK